MKRLSLVAVCFCLFATSATPISNTTATVYPTSVTLPIDPRFQSTPEWCWLAVCEMVFEYKGIAAMPGVYDYQCGVIATLGASYVKQPIWNYYYDYYGFIHWVFGGYYWQFQPGPCSYDCRPCGGFASGNFGEVGQVIRQVLRNYPIFTQITYNNTPYGSHPVISYQIFSPLGKNGVMNQLSHQRPIIVGISPSDTSPTPEPQHIALIVGYNHTTGGGINLIVNDPFPFNNPVYGSIPDPYLANGATMLQPGQYQIDYLTFVYNMRWKQTLYGVH